MATLKKDAVAAAIARAKAKAQQTESASEAPVEKSGDTSKKDAVAAAIARAKTKAQQAKQVEAEAIAPEIKWKLKFKSEPVDLKKLLPLQ
ncbi:hypothetical protein O9992_03235 [Vibrio lentus]|nr:hypothetical protein [Vibrio lentus]